MSMHYARLQSVHMRFPAEGRTVKHSHRRLSGSASAHFLRWKHLKHWHVETYYSYFRKRLTMYHQIKIKKTTDYTSPPLTWGSFVSHHGWIFSNIFWLIFVACPVNVRQCIHLLFIFTTFMHTSNFSHGCPRDGVKISNRTKSHKTRFNWLALKTYLKKHQCFCFVSRCILMYFSKACL